MNSKQHTIKEPVSVSGVGLHTGVEVNMTFNPAPANHGIKFRRTDIEGQPIINALAENVVDLSRGTTLGNSDDVRIGTVEHTLAAIVGMQIDNILIDLDGPETPIMDGSSEPFVKAIEKSGLEEQGAIRDYIEITESITYTDPERNVEMTAIPNEEYRVTVMVDYNSHVLGSQHASLSKIESFGKEIAPCRTFCFLHELEMLRKQNLIRGGDLDNAIVVVDKVVDDEELKSLATLFNKPAVHVKEEGILNNVELRFKNEPARHKLLDVVGDLALIGKPLKAHVLAARPGHAANVAFAKKIRKSIASNKKKSIPSYDPTMKPVFDVKEVYKALPHGHPFRLVDKIIHLDETSVMGVKNVTINEDYFQGHFPDNPVMPGVLQVESIAQTGGIFVLQTVPDPENYWTFFLGIKNFKFRHPVVPGDTLIIRCELLAPIKRGLCQMIGQAWVGDKLVCEGEILASIIRKK